MANYVLNDAKMFVDITDNIAIVINSETGIYYGMNEFGTAVFDNILKGASTESILVALKALLGVPSDIEIQFNTFLKACLDSELIIAGKATEVEVGLELELAKKNNFALEVREYNDAQELLLADPIHEVKEETGWAPDKSALNPDTEDVAKREEKARQ
jgi:hypothetical protein